MKLSGIGRLIDRMCSEEFFNELRTIEELGYVCFSSIKRIYSKEMLGFVVQSEKSVDFLEKRILKFIEDFKNRIKNISEGDFEVFKDSLISSYEEPITNLESLTSFILSQYEINQIDLDFNKKMIEIIRGLKIEDLIGSNIFDSYYCFASFSKD